MPWLELSIFAPIVGAILVTLIPKDQLAAIRYTALGVTLVTFLFSIGVIAGFDSSDAGFQLGSTLGWIPDWGVSYITGIDGISLFLIPMKHPGLEVQSLPTVGKDTTNQVFFKDVFVPDDYLVGKRGQGFQMISEALDLERFTMFTLSPIAERVKLTCEWLRAGAARDGVPLKDDPVVRSKIARLVTDAAVARCHSLRFVWAAIQSEEHGTRPPSTQASSTPAGGGALAVTRARTKTKAIATSPRQAKPVRRTTATLIDSSPRRPKRPALPNRTVAYCVPARSSDT